MNNKIAFDKRIGLWLSRATEIKSKPGYDFDFDKAFILAKEIHRSVALGGVVSAAGRAAELIEVVLSRGRRTELELGHARNAFESLTMALTRLHKQDEGNETQV